MGVPLAFGFVRAVPPPLICSTRTENSFYLSKKDLFSISRNGSCRFSHILRASLHSLRASLHSRTGPIEGIPRVSSLSNPDKTYPSKLQNLAGQHTDVMETLSPKVRKRVEALKMIESEHDELEAKFLEERAALEAKYRKLHEPLYTKRFEIVNGVVEVEEVTEASMEQGEDKASEGKGVPHFWLTAMKNNDILAEEISERDEEALKYLKDIKWSQIDNPKGFKLEFSFGTNPFFKNSVLTKTYHTIDDDYDDEPTLEKAIGTQIEWYPGKCLTQKVLKKKPKKGAKNAKPIIKTEKCESFFNFFNPPEVPDEEDEVDEVDAEERRYMDYDISCTIRDEIIPHAVSWFTGEAAQDDQLGMADDNDNEEE